MGHVLTMAMDNDKSPTLLQVVKSVLAAFFGVQSETNRERDFTQGNPAHFILAGLLLTLVFVLVLWGIVKLVLTIAGV
jgi:uncharacterized membrane protein YhdT